MTRYVLDASVAITARRPNESAYVDAKARLARAMTGEDTLTALAR